MSDFSPLREAVDSLGQSCAVARTSAHSSGGPPIVAVDVSS